MKYIAIVQARTSSTRLKNKIMKKILNKTVIEILLRRLSKSKLIDKIVVATTTNKKDDKLVNLLKKIKYEFYRGSEENVLKRYFDVSKKYHAQFIVRITADNPIIDPKIVDDVIKLFEKTKVDYCTNENPPTFPQGLCAEVFSYKALFSSFNKTRTKSETEHVTIIMRKSKNIKKANLYSKENLSNIRLSLDEQKDLIVIRKVFNHFKKNIHFSYFQLCKLIKEKPNLFKINNHLAKDWQKKRLII